MEGLVVGRAKGEESLPPPFMTPLVPSVATAARVGEVRGGWGGE